MTDEDIYTRLEAMKKSGHVACAELYSVLGGYDCDGGHYDRAQTRLALAGWRYLIGTDEWVAPTDADHHGPTDGY